MPILSRKERMDIAKHYGFQGGGGRQLRRFLDNNNKAAGTIKKRQGHVKSGQREATDYNAGAKTSNNASKPKKSGPRQDTGVEAKVSSGNTLGNSERTEVAKFYGWNGDGDVSDFYQDNSKARGTLQKRQGHVTSGKRTASDYTQNRDFRDNQVLSGFERRDVAESYGYDGKSNLINFFQENKGAFGTIQKRRQQVADGERTANQYLENNYPGRFKTVTERNSTQTTPLNPSEYPNPNKGTNNVPGDVLPKKGGQRSGNFDQNKALNPGARGGVRRRRLLG